MEPMVTDTMVAGPHLTLTEDEHTIMALAKMVHRLAYELRKYPAEAELCTEALMLVGPIRITTAGPQIQDFRRCFTTAIPLHRRRASDRCTVCSLINGSVQVQFFNDSHYHRKALMELTRYQVPKATWDIDGLMRFDQRVIRRGDVMVATTDQFYHFERTLFDQHFKVL